MRHAVAIIALGVVAVLLFGVTGTPAAEAPPATTDTTTKPVDGTRDIQTASSTEAREDRGQVARVARVIDGDTIKLENDSSMLAGETVRYIGVDTPETVHPQREPECYGREASRANRQLVEGKQVRLVRDTSNRDTYGRLLRYVYVGDTFVNEWLVRNGYAHTSSYPPDVAHQKTLRAAERQARADAAGLWGGCTAKPSSDDARDCDIKGNISHNDNEKIYHTPDCDYYEETVISEDTGERWFCSEREARQAGWRKAYNCP